MAHRDSASSSHFYVSDVPTFQVKYNVFSLHLTSLPDKINPQHLVSVIHSGHKELQRLAIQI